MSRTPVREALKILANEGIVEIKNGIGIYVKTISLKDIKDIFEVRKNLELLAVETSLKNISKEELDVLERELNQMLEKIDIGKKIDDCIFNDIDVNLHELLIEKCENKYVVSLINGIKTKISIYQYLSFSELGNLKESINQHLDLIRIAREGDVNKLKKSLLEHLDWALNVIIKKEE
jgi:DNA-binding GntR family transcriptional regulator